MNMRNHLMADVSVMPSIHPPSSTFLVDKKGIYFCCTSVTVDKEETAMHSKMLSRYFRLVVFTISLVAISSGARAQNPDDLIFYEGNGCTQDIVFTYNSHVDADDNCKKRGACKGDNDEARSVKIAKTVKPGARIEVFDDPGGSTEDDRTVIIIVNEAFLEPEGYCLHTFETSFDNPNSNSGIRVEYHPKNGLDGKISRVRVTASPPGSTGAPLSLSWTSLGGAFTSPPAVVSWAPNRLDIFALGDDRAMYQKTWDGSQWLPSHDGWTSLGGAFTSPPAAVSWAPNRLDIFGLGDDRAMYQKTWDGSQWLPSF